MDSELSSRSEGRSLRLLKRVDYNKMHKGGNQTQDGEKLGDSDPSEIQDGEGEQLENPSGASIQPGSSGSLEAVYGQDSPLFKDDKEQDELEMESIALQMKRLNAEEARLERKQRLDHMRRELKEQQERVRSMKGKDLMFTTKTGDFGEKINSDNKGARPKVISSKSDNAQLKVTSSKSKSKAKSAEKLKLTDIDLSGSDTEQITIEDLRKNPKLQNKVKKELKKIGLSCNNLDSSSSSVSSSSSSESSSSSDSESIKKKKKHRKHKKSGINAKASDRVKNPQKWPHAHLQYEFVNKQMKFDELDMKMFIAGEMEIISAEDLSDSERKGRLNLLKKIVYYTNIYEFKGLKAFYAAWLREIELGKKSWSDDTQHIESAILSKYLLKKSGFSSSSKKEFQNKNDANEDRTWFCSEYQRNKCKHKSSHLRVHNGKQKLASHICAACWLKEKKKLEHPECSSSCPHLAD